jgi:hypothetical protein
MIKATDLRINNVVLIKTAKGDIIPWKVQVLTLLGHDNSYEGMPITGEALIDLGFTQHHGDYYNGVLLIKNVHRNLPVEIMFYPLGIDSAIYIKDVREVRFIHELQNIFHSLTSKELPGTDKLCKF